MTLDAQKVERSVYNFFALLGDVGGFFGLIVGVFASIDSVFNFQKAENTQNSCSILSKIMCTEQTFSFVFIFKVFHHVYFPILSCKVISHENAVGYSFSCKGRTETLRCIPEH